MAQSISTSEGFQGERKKKFNLRILLGVMAIAITGYWGSQQLIPTSAPTVLTISGRLEADETNIGVKTGGRITQILVREGDSVKVGQVVALLEDEEVDQQLQAALAQLTAAQQEEAQARWEVSVVQSRIQEAQANLAQAKQDSQGRVRQAESTVAVRQSEVEQAKAQVVRDQAEINRAEAQLKLAQADLNRYAELAEQGVISRQQFDQVKTNVDTTQASLEATRAALTAQIATVKTAEQQLQAAQGNLIQNRSTTLNSDIRGSQLAAYQQQAEQANARLAEAKARVQVAMATQRQLEKRLDSFKVRSPTEGIVQDRPLEPGAVVSSGKTLLTVIDPQTVYLRAYVPEGDIGKIYTGKPARVFLDSYPQKPLAAKVSTIDAQASFTPENIYFPKDRVRQVFGVKLTIEQGKNYAKPGMPANAEIDVL
jgi:HlyD family secretion protein